MRSAIESSTFDALYGAGASELLHFPKTFGTVRGGISSVYRTAFLLLLLTVPVWAQSVAITSPADGATIQAVNLTNGRELAVTVTVTEGSGKHTTMACLTANGKPVTPNPCSYSTPWTIKAYPGFWGDGAVDYVVTTYDINGAVLATSAKHTATTRLTGLTNSMTVSGTSGAITVSSHNWNGFAAGGGCAGHLYVDGFAIPSGTSPYAASTSCGTDGINYNGFDTTKWRNGNHELFFDLQSSTFGNTPDPFVPSNSFVAGNIAGSPSTITLTQPVFLVTNRPIFFTTSGTLPTPLIAGAFWGTYASTTSPSNLIVSDICSSGSCTVTLNASPGVSNGATVDIEDAYNLNLNAEEAACEGPLTVTGTSGNTFTVSAPGCPDGTMNIGGQEAAGTLAIVTNAYYAIWLTGTTIQVAATPNGSAIALGAGSSGTQTVAGQVRNGYWRIQPGDSQWSGTSSAFARLVVDFENGHTAMDYWPSASEINLTVGQIGASLCGEVVYTDGMSPLVPPALDCSLVTYNVVPDGGITGVVTVNTTTGVPTGAAPGWARITSTYSTFPVRTTYVHVCTTTCTQPTFTHDGHVATSYTPGQSFVPTSWWNLDLSKVTLSGISNVNDQPLFWPRLMKDSGINTSMNGSGALGVNQLNPSQPQSIACPSLPTLADSRLDTVLNQWNIFQEIDVNDFQRPVLNLGTLWQNTGGFNRQTCVKNGIADRKAGGRTIRFSGIDESTINTGTGAPNCTGVVGTPCFTNITVSGGVATVHGQFALTENVWNQANGTGAAFRIKNATNTCLLGPNLDGWQYVTGKTNGSDNFTTTFTFFTSCTGPTYDGSTDPGLTIQYLGIIPVNAVGGPFWIHACQLPKYVGLGGGTPNYTYQGWTTVNDGNGNFTADTSLSSLTSNGSLLTIVNNGNLWTDGQSIAIQGASTAALNGLHVIHVVNANTATTPTTAASGSYTPITDPNLLISSDCNLPTDYYAQLHTIFHQGGDIAFQNTIKGAEYQYPRNIINWYNPTVSDTIMVYHPQGAYGIYGDDVPVYQSQLANQNYTLVNRAYQPALRANLNSFTMEYEKQHFGYLFDPAQDNPLANQFIDRPETQAAGIMSDVTFGIVSERIYTFRQLNAQQYLRPIGSQAGSGTGPEYNKPWAAISRAFQAMQHLDRYILQPHTTSPYFGLMYNTLQTTSSYGNMLVAVCLLDGGTTETRTIDLTGIRQAGGSIYRMSLSGYRLRFDTLAGNPTSDTYTMCGAGAGETVAYVAQPSGAVSDLAPTTFTPPSTLPYGATKYGLRVGYYPGEMHDDPVTDCTSGCTIDLHRAGGPVWFQVIYANNSWTPLATGDPTMLAGQ